MDSYVFLLCSITICPVFFYPPGLEQNPIEEDCERRREAYASIHCLEE